MEEQTSTSGRPADSTDAASYDQAIAAVTADFDNLEQLVRTRSFDRRQWVKPVLEELSQAGSFRSAERRMRSLLTLADCLTEADLQHAATSIRENNQIYQASDTPQLLLNLYRETSNSPGAKTIWKELAQGLHDDYMDDHDDVDGYYSYKELLDEVSDDLL